MATDKLSLYSVVPVWLVVAASATIILLLAPTDPLLWLQVVLAAGIILTFGVQLGLDRKEGLVTRVMASLGGAVVILAMATGIAALLGMA